MLIKQWLNKLIGATSEDLTNEIAKMAEHGPAKSAEIEEALRGEFS